MTKCCYLVYDLASLNRFQGTDIQNMPDQRNADGRIWNFVDIQHARIPIFPLIVYFEAQRSLERAKLAELVLLSQLGGALWERRG